MTTKTSLKNASITSAKQLLERSGFVVERAAHTIPVNISERDDAEKSSALLAQLQERAGVDLPAITARQRSHQKSINARFLANAQ